MNLFDRTRRRRALRKSPNSPKNRLTPRFERLEERSYLAADLAFNGLGSSVPVDGAGGSSGSPASIAELPRVPAASAASAAFDGAEGEGDQTTAIDLVAFAKAIAASGSKFYGAAWCRFCTQQKEQFQDGGKYLPFIEVTNPDRTLNSIGIEADISAFPTWEFPDGSRETGVLTFDALSTRTGVPIPMSNQPFLAELPAVTIRAGVPFWVPLDGYDPNADRLSYSVTATSPGMLATTIPTTNRSLKVRTVSWGEMTFQLFDDIVPSITNHVAQLASSGFYNRTTSQSMKYDRVVQTAGGAFIQTGDAQGTGGSSLGSIDDVYDVRLQYASDGMLALARTTDDTGDSRFMITNEATRQFDFEYPIFGRQTEGAQVRSAINGTLVNGETPTRDVVVDTVEVYQDYENGVLMLSAPVGTSGGLNVTVTVSDGQGHSNSRTFAVTIVADSFNAGPFLKPISSVITGFNQTVNLQLQSVDPEGDAVQYAASTEMPGAQVVVNPTTGALVITPPTDFIGEFDVKVSVRTATGIADNTIDPLDEQTIRVSVAETTNAWQNAVRPLDVNDDGVIAPNDVLLIINELNSHRLSAADGKLPPTRPANQNPVQMIDTSGDGYVSPRDALAIINYLNSPPSAEGEDAASSQLDDAAWHIALLQWLDENSARQRLRPVR